ncbi:hypothetical protein ACWV26_15705 [Rummeliibacillus sp. JY-2-4R]
MAHLFQTGLPSLLAIGHFLFKILLVANTFRHYDFLKNMIFHLLEWTRMIKRDSFDKERPLTLMDIALKVLFFTILIYLFVITNTYLFFVCFSVLKSFEFFQQKSNAFVFPYLKKTKWGNFFEKDLVKNMYFLLLFFSIVSLLFLFTWSYIALMVIYTLRCYDFLSTFIKDGFIGSRLSNGYIQLEKNHGLFMGIYLISTILLFPILVFFKYALAVIWTIRALKTYVFLKKIDMKYIFITQVQEAIMNTIIYCKMAFDKLIFHSAIRKYKQSTLRYSVSFLLGSVIYLVNMNGGYLGLR